MDLARRRQIAHALRPISTAAVETIDRLRREAVAAHAAHNAKIAAVEAEIRRDPAFLPATARYVICLGLATPITEDEIREALRNVPAEIVEAAFAEIRAALANV